MSNFVWSPHIHTLLKAIKLTDGSISKEDAPEPSKDNPPAPRTDETQATETTVEDTSTVENSVELLLSASTGNVNPEVVDHLKQGSYEASGRGQEAETPVSKDIVVPTGAPYSNFIKHPYMDSLSSTIHSGVGSNVMELASGDEAELHIVRDQPMDDSTIANSGGREINNVEDPAKKEPQNTGGHAGPTYEGLHIHSEKDWVAITSLGQVERGPESQAGVIRVPDGK